ncbi:MAG: M15 family metallopeptidase [Butyrivibrio sp.]|nr:M15 family metallopeptidase [Butyrivibrio sp.]
MEQSFRERLTDRVRTFVLHHRKLKIPAMIYMVIVLSVYDLCSFFAHNGKRFACLACILMFFAASSSFSYPKALTLNISFVAEVPVDQGTFRDAVPASDENTAEVVAVASDAELAQEQEVDASVLEETEDFIRYEEVLDDDAEFVSLADILRENEELLNHAVDESQTEKVSTSDLHFDRNDWRLILVNKQHPIPDHYDFKLGYITPTQQCDERILSSLLQMMKTAQQEGAPLAICSPYRSGERQQNNFEQHIRRYMKAGMSYMDAYNRTARVVTIPGSSEHEIGMAIDIVQNDHYALDEAFGETKAGIWLRDNSYRFGFILRYPKDKEEITGIEYEPWHFRYVGVDAATLIHDQGLCLEEFWSIYLHE